MKRGYFKSVGTSAALGSITSLRNIGEYDSKTWYASNSGTTLAVYSVASLTGAATAEHTRATAAGATIHNAALRINNNYIMAAWMVSYNVLGTTYYFVYMCVYVIGIETWVDITAYSVGTTEGRIIDVFQDTNIYVLFTDGTTLKIASAVVGLTVDDTLATLKDDQAVWGGYYNDITDKYEFLVYKDDDKFYKVTFDPVNEFVETEYDYFDPPSAYDVDEQQWFSKVRYSTNLNYIFLSKYNFYYYDRVAAEWMEVAVGGGTNSVGVVWDVYDDGVFSTYYMITYIGYNNSLYKIFENGGIAKVLAPASAEWTIGYDDWIAAGTTIYQYTIEAFVSQVPSVVRTQYGQAQIGRAHV